MKTRLTTEQSQHLIDLGVPKEKASETELYNDPSSWIRKVAPIFKLEDFLNGEILPKRIEYNNGTTDLVMTFGGMDLEGEIKEWFAYYDDAVGTYGFHAEELIDALYQLACWYYGEFLKS